MEWLLTLLIVFFIVLLVGAVFSSFGARGPWPSVIWFFLLLFFATWAIGAWVRPVGPEAWGVPWLAFLVVAVFVALLIAAATPGDRYSYDRAKELPLERDADLEPEAVDRRSDYGRETPAGVAAATAIGVFFWIFLVMAAALFFLSLLWAPAV